MIVKGIIEKKVGYNEYEVRVPIIDKVKGASLSSENLSIASVCSITNSSLDLNINDVVYINYENNDKSKPIIIGCLSNNNRSSYLFDSITVSNSAKLPNNIKIGDITYSELSCLENSNDIIEDQITKINENIDNSNKLLENSLNNKDDLNNNISNIENNVSDIDLKFNNIDNVLGDELDTSNTTFYGKYNDLLKNANKIDKYIVPSDTTVSNTLDSLISRLITLKEYVPSTSTNTEDDVANNNLSETIVEKEESSYEDNIKPVWSSSSEFRDIIAALRRKFPDGKYWNHSPTQGNTSYNGVNNQDGYTSKPCPRHHNCGTSTQTCNGYAPSGYETSWQCMGYANKCGYDVTGYDPEKSSKWKKSSSSESLKTLKGGDIIRYKNDGHSIYVIDVSGSTIKYTDCNSDAHCVIRWDAKIDKSTIEKSFTYVRISPTDLSKSRLLKKVDQTTINTNNVV